MAAASLAAVACWGLAAWLPAQPAGKSRDSAAVTAQTRFDARAGCDTTVQKGPTYGGTHRRRLARKPEDGCDQGLRHCCGQQQASPVRILAQLLGINVPRIPCAQIAQVQLQLTVILASTRGQMFSGGSAYMHAVKPRCVSAKACEKGGRESKGLSLAAARM